MYSLCLNPCFDRMIELNAFTLGSMNRVALRRREVSGKGVNVAIMARRLGLDSGLTGFSRRDGGAEMAALLKREDVALRCIDLPGALRENIKILDRSKQTVTEVNEAGDVIAQEHVDALIALADGLAVEGDTWVITGSMPPGCPVGLYGTLIARLKERGVACVLDAEGEALIEGLRAAPVLVKPNQFELESAFGRALPSPAALRDAALSLCARGIGQVVVSMGRDGALATDGTATYYAHAVDIDVRSSVGAGDSMVAGLLYARSEGFPLDASLRWGVAAATAAVALPGTELPTVEEVRQWVDHVDTVRMK